MSTVACGSGAPSVSQNRKPPEEIKLFACRSIVGWWSSRNNSRNDALEG